MRSFGGVTNQMCRRQSSVHTYRGKHFVEALGFLWCCFILGRLLDPLCISKDVSVVVVVSYETMTDPFTPFSVKAMEILRLEGVTPARATIREMQMNLEGKDAHFPPNYFGNWA